MNTGSRTLDLIIQLVGEEAALALVREYGGTQLKFVRGVSRTSAATRQDIADKIGEAAYETLFRHYGAGQPLAIPMASALLRQKDASEACRLLDTGLTTSEVALRLKRSYRWVERISKKVPDPVKVAQARRLEQMELVL